MDMIDRRDHAKAATGATASDEVAVARVWLLLARGEASLMAGLAALGRCVLDSFAEYGRAHCHRVEPDKPARWRAEELTRLLDLPE